jgi:hypothetical protein
MHLRHTAQKFCLSYQHDAIMQSTNTNGFSEQCMRYAQSPGGG